MKIARFIRLALEALRGSRHAPIKSCRTKQRVPTGDGSGSGNNGGDNGIVRGNKVFDDIDYTEMVYVEGGTFLMGTQSEDSDFPNYDPDAFSNESPVHQVTLSDYYIGKYEVTQGLWEYVMCYSGTCADGSLLDAYFSGPWPKYRPLSTYGIGDNYPAYFVSWNDIVEIFLPRLNKITGKEYRLPTEAEWEYAARGGSMSQGYKYSGSNTIGDVAWYSGNSGHTTHPVGTKQPNELGIYDMSGNVYEWCCDWFSKYTEAAKTDPTGSSTVDSRIHRGGNIFLVAQDCRVSNRLHDNPGLCRLFFIGFRLALSR